MIFFEFFKLSSYGFVVYILAFDIPVVLTNRKRNANIYMALTMAWSINSLDFLPS